MLDRWGLLPTEMMMTPEPVRLRPLLASDRAALRRFYEGLTPDTTYARFFVERINDSTLDGLTAPVDQRAHLAVVAEAIGLDGSAIVGVARLVSDPDHPSTGEVGIVVDDTWQRRGIGGRLVRRLGVMAWREGIVDWTIFRLAENVNVDRLVGQVARELTAREDGGIVETNYRLLTAGVAVSTG